MESVSCKVRIGNLPESIKALDVRTNALSGTVRVPDGFALYSEENEQLTVERIEE